MHVAGDAVLGGGRGEGSLEESGQSLKRTGGFWTAADGEDRRSCVGTRWEVQLKKEHWKQLSRR